MAERDRLFTLNRARYREIWQAPWLELQHEFKTMEVLLSQSLLVWKQEESETLLVTDFENQKTYEIHQAVDIDEQPTMEVWEQVSEPEQPITGTDTDAILEFLRTSPQGTDQGFIDYFKKIDLVKLDLERLKRTDLSGAGYSFELAQRDLLIVHRLLIEISSAPRESLFTFSNVVAQNLKDYLPRFYESIQKIESFDARGENPQETHADHLRTISSSCDSIKGSLVPVVTHLSSAKVEQLAAEADDSVAKLKIETDRAAEISREAEKQREEVQQELSQLRHERQTQQAKESVADYKEIFEKQAREYCKGARIWLGAAGVATVVFFAAFVGLTIWLGSEGSGLTGTLQNLFTKGFLLSPIYVWLNRSIKSHAAQKHLEVINTHREKALETFNRFFDAAQNQETRDAVLRSATDAIFDANQTGYLSTKGSTADGKSPVQQVIREIIPDRSSQKN